MSLGRSQNRKTEDMVIILSLDPVARWFECEYGLFCCEQGLPWPTFIRDLLNDAKWTAMNKNAKCPSGKFHCCAT